MNTRIYKIWLDEDKDTCPFYDTLNNIKILEKDIKIYYEESDMDWDEYENLPEWDGP